MRFFIKDKNHPTLVLTHFCSKRIEFDSQLFKSIYKNWIGRFFIKIKNGPTPALTHSSSKIIESNSHAPLVFYPFGSQHYLVI